MAATLSVDSNLDLVDANPGDGSCRAEPLPVCTLRAATMEANGLAGPDTVELPGDTFRLSRLHDEVDDPGNNDLDVSDDLVLVGRGAERTTIDAAGIDRALHVQDASLELRDLTVTNGDARSTDDRFGGAIWASAVAPRVIRLERVALLENRAAASGGALRVDGGATVQIIGGTISRNSVAPGPRLSGAGVAVDAGSSPADVSIHEATLTNNVARSPLPARVEGGAVSVRGSSRGGSLHVEGSLFSGNEAGLAEGAPPDVYCVGGGGALYAPLSTTIEDSDFAGNRLECGEGSTEGGAAVLGGPGFPSAPVEVSASTFTENVNASGAGGAIRTYVATIRDSHFAGNRAATAGGAIRGSDSATLASSTLSGNTVRPGNRHFEWGGGGGAFELEAVIDSTVVGNAVLGGHHGSDGGGLRSVGVVKGSTVRSNEARALENAAFGGGIADVERIEESTVSGNLASGTSVFGGGIYAHDSRFIEIVNSTVSGNRARGVDFAQGGGLEFTGSNATIRASTFAYNAAAAPLARGGNVASGNQVHGLSSIAGSVVGEGSSQLGPGCFFVAPLPSVGGNVERYDDCAFRGQGDLASADPLLAPLGDYGGPTETHALRSGSPAAGLFAQCPPPSSDQRGVERFQGSCDAGAFEGSVAGPFPPWSRFTGGPHDGAHTNDTTPTFAYATDGKAEAECRLDSEPWGSCAANETHTPRGDLAEGAHSIELRAVSDSLGAGPVGLREFVVDTATPDTRIASGPPPRGTDNQLEFELDSERFATFECSLDASAFEPCESFHYPAGPIADGAHVFRARAIDRAGNVDPTPAEHEFSIDSSPPDTRIDAGPASPTRDSRPEFEFSSPDGSATFECSFDSDPRFGPCSGESSHRPAQALADGSHQFAVRAVDPHGNRDRTPALAWVRVDTKDPETTITDRPDSVTRDSVPGFRFRANESAAFECRFDGEAFGLCSGGQAHSPTQPLADGSHTFEVRASDEAGNRDPSPATFTFVVDTLPPDTEVRQGPPSFSSDNRPHFEFDSEPGATFECAMNEESFQHCDRSYRPEEALADGEHVLTVRAVDRARNHDRTPSSHEFTVDTRSPQTQIDAGPAGPTSDSQPVFEFSSSEANTRFECAASGDESFGPCSGARSHRSETALADGPHVIRVRAVDRAGNVDSTPARRAFEVDTVAPVVTVTAAPRTSTRRRRVRFEFAVDEPDVSTICVLDRVATACSSPYRSPALDFGRHRWSVVAVDEAGNTGTASVPFRVTRR
jgi:hypothetical protein